MWTDLTGWEIFLAVAHVVAASGVSVHVLLTHREVRSSIGWIGLSWLSPFIGSSIYVAFGVNRVVRRTIRTGLKLQRGALVDQSKTHKALSEKLETGIISIAKAAHSISGLSLTVGNSIEFYCDGNEAYPVMLRAIGEARHTIALAVYIFASDKTGHEFADALVAARKRGVDVRVLVDGVGSGYFRSPVVEHLRKGGVQAEQFLHEWAPWAMTFINLRNHKKLLVVDGKTGFTGGMNISDDNVSAPGEIPKVQDVHACLRGPIVVQLLQTFERDWEFTTSATLEGEGWWPRLGPVGDVAMRGVASGPDENIGKVEALFATAIEQAQHRIRIVTPYFLPEESLFEVLHRAAMRGVCVEILVPEKTNHFYFDWAMAAHFATFTLEGINCFMVSGGFDHSKLMSVDGQWCSIGSANWDARSMRLNFEYQVECYGSGVTSQVDRIIDRKMIGARRLNPAAVRNLSLPVRLRNAAARLFLPYL